MQTKSMQKNTVHKNTLRVAATALAFITLAITGCGGGGGGSSHDSQPSSSSNSSGSVQGVATPSNLSVVTAQNANAGS